jgi:hypothetical protein
MAELIIKVNDNGPDPAWRDGDILHCFNQRRIRWTWAEELCHPKYFGFKRDGLRPNSLALKYLQHTHQYQYTRVTHNEILRYEMRTGKIDIINATPNAKGEYCHVDTYIKRRLAHPRHRIFGSPGKEEWYLGHKDFSAEVMERVWADIEADTGFSETMFTRFPLAWETLKTVLVLQIPELSDAECQEYEKEVREDSIDPIKGRPIQILRKRRDYMVPYRDLDFVDIDAVTSMAHVTDYRDHVVPLAMIQSKSEVMAWQP